MSGPVADIDVENAERPPTPAGPAQVLEVTPSRETAIGAMQIRRALPRRGRRTVGAWCFIDHMGPSAVTTSQGLDVAPHPHIGLQTVTWLLEGEIVHRDSLGSEQVIRPGAVNLMTAGYGVAHSEEHTGYLGDLHGVQLWVAQPTGTRETSPAFEHHVDLPQCDLGEGSRATVLVGELDGAVSPARRDSDLMGAELDLRSAIELPLQSTFEYGLVVLRGTIMVENTALSPGHLAYLGPGRSELRLAPDGEARVLLLGGVPFDEPILMWWNFVARTQDEISAAYRSWADPDGRYGPVASGLPRAAVGPPPWEARF